MLTAAAARERRFSGIRRVDLRHDLGAIADLIALCFGPRMDAGGRATIREMRALGRLGPLLGLMAMTDDMLRGIGQGFVWVAEGQIVGNVTLFPADFPPELGRTTIIANVAVHPDYRRRGIARRLMAASLEAIRAGGGTAAILQVEAENTGACQLYERLGFRVQRTWHEWRRGTHGPIPPRPLNAPRITLRPPNAWREEYALAARLFPAERGGLGWMRPLHPREFRRSLGRHVLDFLSGTGIERWIIREDRQIAASLWAKSRFGSATTQLTLLVHPARQGTLEAPLLNYAIRRLAVGYRALYCEHPADDAAATAAFERCDFTRRRTLHHMRLDL